MLMPGAALPATLSTSGITTPVLSQGQALEAVTQGISQKDTTFTKIFVGGLPYHTTDKSLREHFEVYGEIEEAVVITDRQTGKSRGYGFVTMADKGGADRAIKEPNPVIDGRKANVNLAYLGAKPRGPAADASSSLLLRQVAASQPYFATTQLLQQRAAFQPVNMAQAAAAAQGAYGNQMAAAAAAGMTTQLRYPIPSPTLVAGGTGTMQSIDYGGLHAISSATDPYGIGSTAVTAAASSTTTGEMSAIPDSPSEDYADSPNSGIPLTGVRYPTVLPGQYGEPGPGSAGGVVRTPRASHTFSPYTRIHPNYVYHPSFMQTAAGLLPMAATAPVAHASQLAATQAYYDYAATAATAAYPATYPATAATAASLEPYAAAVSAGTQQAQQAISPGTAASAMYGTGYSWQQAAAAQAAAVAASAGNIPGFSYATQPQMAQEAARMQ